MVALLKENGDFTPMSVVRDTEKYKQLVEAMKKPAQPAPGLVEMLRQNNTRFVVRSK